MGTDTRIRRFARALAMIALLAAPSPAIAREAASIDMKTLEGKSVSIQDLRGEVVILNFWATWCKPCVAEMPVLAKLAERFGRRGLHVIAASVDDTASHAELEQFADRLPKGMEVWVGATMSDLQQMEVQALPTTIIIDRKGTLVRVHHGQLGEGYLDEMLDKLLGSAPDRPPAPPKPFDATQA